MRVEPYLVVEDSEPEDCPTPREDERGTDESPETCDDVHQQNAIPSRQVSVYLGAYSTAFTLMNESVTPQIGIIPIPKRDVPDRNLSGFRFGTSHSGMGRYRLRRDLVMECILVPSR